MEKEFVYFMQLSNHQWGDGNGKQCFWYIPTEPFTENNNVDFALWDETVERIQKAGFTMALIDVGDAVQYASHPEISAPDAVSREFLKKKLDEMRTRGITPIPKLNFSTVHDCWLKEYRRMISSQLYRKVCVELIDEVCELFDHPKLFHLGMDEEASMDCQQWRESVIIRGEKLFWEDFNLFFDACRKNGARPWVWGDNFWNRPESFKANMPKDVLISNWFYGRFRDYPATHWYRKAIAGYADFEAMGFDQMPTCSTCGDNDNPEETLKYCPTVISDEHLKGFVFAPWVEMYRENELVLQDGIRRFAAAREKVFGK